MRTSHAGTAMTPPAPADDAEGDDALASLRADFPRFRIWRENFAGRVRYIARSQHPGQHPHTIVTDDPGELCAALSGTAAQPNGSQPASPGTARFSPEIPHPARVYNVWLGGKDTIRPTERPPRRSPPAVRRWSPAHAPIGRSWPARCSYLAGQRGIRQFLDIGPGLPAPDATHTVAQAIAPESKIVYVDNDPLVLAHARALLTSSREGVCEYLDADLRDPETILKEAARTLDFTQPAAVILVAVLHFLPDADDPAGHRGRARRRLSAGQLRGDLAPDGRLRARAGGVGGGRLQRLVPAGITARSHAEVTALFGGLSLLAPGVVPVSEWRPDHAPVRGVRADMYAGLATVTGRSR